MEPTWLSKLKLLQLRSEHIISLRNTCIRCHAIRKAMSGVLSRRAVVLAVQRPP